MRQSAFSSQGAGFGDIFLNYRYQAIGNGETRVAFAPRISLIVPSGNSNLGQGFDAAGAQTKSTQSAHDGANDCENADKIFTGQLARS